MLTFSPIYKIIKEHGLFVLPLYSVDGNNKCTCGKNDCSSPGKHPYFKYNWKITASNDENKIKKWCEKHQDLNWAVLTGRKSLKNNKYLVVVDIDNIDHDIIKTLPKTFGYSTGNGYHFWFWSDTSVKNSVSLVDKKVDIRAFNGYVVVPPSKHVSGRKYKFINENCEIADLPSEFKKSSKPIETVKIKKETKKDVKVKNTVSFNILDNLPIPSIRRILDNDYKIPDGARNKTIFRLLCSDRAKGSEQEELIKNALCYREKCENFETITASEISTLVSSVVKYPPNNNLNRRKISNENKIKIEFFDRYIPSKTSWVSLKDVAKEYKSLYDEDLDMYEASYVLKDIGFSKKRTSKGNVWGLIKKV